MFFSHLIAELQGKVDFVSGPCPGEGTFGGTMLTVFARVLFLACAAESEGQLPAALVAEEGVEESARRSEPALDESLVRLGGEILEAFGDDGGMAGRELSVLADPGIAETIPPT